MKNVILMSLLLFYLLGNSQKSTIGIGFTYGFDVDYDKINGYEFEKGQKDSYIGFCLHSNILLYKGFGIKPYVNLPLGYSSTIAENTKGTDVPDGNYIQVPYKTVGGGWTTELHSDFYLYHQSEVKSKQNQFGLMATYTFPKYLSIGAGILYAKKKYLFIQYNAIDTYGWTSSTGTQYDNYLYETTDKYEYGSNPTLFVESFYVPLSIDFNYDMGKFQTGASLMALIGEDTHYYLAWTFSVNLIKDTNN